MSAQSTQPEGNTPLDTYYNISDDIATMFDRLLVPDNLVELRILDTGKGVISGYYDDFQKMAADARRMSGKASGIYMTLNLVKPDLKARAYNHLKEYVKATTSDSDIVRRLYLPIDFDSLRPAGISSTDVEHEAAIQCARQCKDWLAALGFSEPILADSGNGAHLLYKIDLPNDAKSRELVESCLRAIDFHFSDSAVKVDLTTGNAARIWKVYGTLARKGDNLPERPHRLAHILEAPSSLEVTAVDLLHKLADMAPKSLDMRSQNGSRQLKGSEFDLDAWIAHYHLPVVSSGGWNGARKWILNPCPWNREHTNKAAYIVQFANGAIAAGCHHDSCAGNGWTQLRSLCEDSDQKDHRRLQTGRQTDTQPHHYYSAQIYSDGHRANSTKLPPALSATSKTDDWPEPPGDAAFDGLAGEIVREFDPHTEADPVALLLQLLTAFGCIAGRTAHMMVGQTIHYARIFGLIVGDTAKARKGDSWSPIRALFDRVDPNWTTNRIVSGLSSGEGLIFAVRDPIVKWERPKGGGELEKVVVDAGVTDKRLLAIEPEFASVLRAISRQGNILSATARNAWDRGDLQTLTKATPLKATGAHISIMGHVTIDELRRELTATEIANGFVNRFNIAAVRRSKLLPRPKPLDEGVMAKLARRLTGRLEKACHVGLMDFTLDSGDLWDESYEALSTPRDGLAGSILARSEAQVLRLAMLYALLDGSAMIDVPHLQAAAELWTYCERSVYLIFGDATGDPAADTIYRALKNNGPMTRTQISTRLFAHHEKATHIDLALQTLLEKGKARMYKVESDGGRSIEEWEAVA